MKQATTGSKHTHSPIGAAAIVRLDGLLLVVAMWAFIGVSAAYDVYLSVKYHETLRVLELNPLGRWLLELDCGNVALFMGCKLLGTIIVLGTLQMLYLYRPNLGIRTTVGVAGVQAAVVVFLNFA